MIERPEGGELAILVHVYFKAPHISEDIHELTELVQSAGAEPVAVFTAHRNVPNVKTFIGKGKVEEITLAVQESKADLVIINHVLAPAQVRNLEGVLKCRVIDRVDLILDIFAKRARTYEGKLQVELAQLQHLLSRLVRGWTHLERQKGGIGLRGPGETQLETDRRLVRDRIKHLKTRLEKVKKQRQQSRQKRQKSDAFNVTFVGYTNAGKSTLFNAVCDAEVYVQDQLFATLDPTMREVSVKGLGSIVLADTVGFIRHLPHDLVEAFHATLEEVRLADVLIHVVDVSDEFKEDKMVEVQAVLQEIGAETVPQIVVFNKIDLADMQPRFEVRDGQCCVWLSAQTSQGLGLLSNALIETLRTQLIRKFVTLKPAQAGLRHAFYEANAVLSEEIQDDGCYKLLLQCPKRVFERVMK